MTAQLPDNITSEKSFIGILRTRSVASITINLTSLRAWQTARVTIGGRDARAKSSVVGRNADDITGVPELHSYS
jgi:hypothetical protein